MILIGFTLNPSLSTFPTAVATVEGWCGGGAGGRRGNRRKLLFNLAIIIKIFNLKTTLVYTTTYLSLVSMKLLAETT
jgi:hypothetical protein